MRALRIDLLLAILAACSVHASTLIWTNTAGGNWNVPDNWQPNQVPGTNDMAVLTNNGSYTVVVSANASPASLVLGGNSGTQTLSIVSSTLTLGADSSVIGNGVMELSGGTLSGAGSLTISNKLNWTAGTLGGSGWTYISPGATLNLANTGAVSLNGRSLDNAGTVLWTGSAELQCQNGVVLTNRAGALWEVRNSQTFRHWVGDPARFENAGVFRKVPDSGTSTFESGVSFFNEGTVELASGTLHFSSPLNNAGVVDIAAGTVLWLSGGGEATGSFELPVDGTLDWAAGAYSLNPGVQLNGTGNYTNRSTLTLNTPVTIQNLGLHGTLNGDGMLTVTSNLNWTAGTMTGSGWTYIPPGAVLNLANAGSVSLNGRSLDNAGTVLWTGSAELQCQNGVVLTNRAGALWEVRNSQTFRHWVGDPARFENAGVFRKTLDASTTAFEASVPFFNYGTISVYQGTLAFGSAPYLDTEGTIEFSLGGADYLQNYGCMTCNQSTQLAGDLTVVFRDGYVPSAGQRFDVILAPNVGEFQSYSAPTISAYIFINPEYYADLLELVTTDPTPVFNATSVDSQNRLSLSVMGIVNQRYAVTASTNFVDWIPLQTNTIPASTVWTFVDEDSATTMPYRFYRVLFLP